MKNRILDKERIGKRFKILASLIIGIMFTIMFVILFLNSAYWLDRISLVLFSVFGIWLLMDTELLQINEYYLKCLFLAILISIGGFIIANIYPTISIVTTGYSMSSLLILLIQWPSRRFYLMLFNREPEFDSDGLGERFSDVLYSMLLLFSGLILPILIIEYLR